MVALLLLSVIVTEPVPAKNWSGDLVDAGCFEMEQQNVSPDYINAPWATDIAFDVKACKPRAKTKSFWLVLDNGRILRLDAAGNEKAAALLAETSKRQRYIAVRVTGKLVKNVIEVDTIAAKPAQ